MLYLVFNAFYRWFGAEVIAWKEFLLASVAFYRWFCAWNNWFTQVQLWRFGRNCCRWTGFIWSLLVTQVVTCIRTTLTPLLLLFIPYKFLVLMMIKFRITIEKEKEEDAMKRPQQNVISFNKSLCKKIWCCIFLSFVFKDMLIKVDSHLSTELATLFETWIKIKLLTTLMTEICGWRAFLTARTAKHFRKFVRIVTQAKKKVLTTHYSFLQCARILFLF